MKIYKMLDAMISEQINLTSFRVEDTVDVNFTTFRANTRVYTTLDGFSGPFFHIFEIIIFCFVVDLCNLVHDVKAIIYLFNCLQHLEFFF